MAGWILLCAMLGGLVYALSGWAGNRQFGLFKKKSPTVMDGLIRLTYGANPPPKSADLERSITIAHEDLLFEKVPLAEVKQRASELFKGPIPYSTHDLAVSTALGFFKSPEYVPALRECQIPARLRVTNWAKDGKVVKPLAASFEEVLYRLYKPQLSEARPERPTTNQESERIISLLEPLLTEQLMPTYKRPREAFSVLMTNKLAAGYVFGFHDSYFQTFGLLDRNNPKADLSVIQNSYQTIFGASAGHALFEMSFSSQKDPEFQIGRQSGGEEYLELIQKKTPRLGLERILTQGFDAAAVSRTLAKARSSQRPTGSSTDTRNAKSPHDYTGAGKALGRIFLEPDIWHEMSKLPDGLVAQETAYARIAIVRDAIRRLQPHSIAVQMLAGVDQYVAGAFAKPAHATTATLAIRLYEQNVSPLTRLADVFERRSMISTVTAAEITPLFEKVAAEAERLMEISSLMQKLANTSAAAQAYESVEYIRQSEVGGRPMTNEEADPKTQKSPSPKPTAMEPDDRQLPKGSTNGLGGGPPQMADYYSVITRAISALPSKTGIENRRGVYERARTALRETLRTRNQPLSETELTKELCALEAAIHRVEKDTAFSGEELADLKRVYPEGKVCFKAKAIRELYGDRQPTPDDGILGWVPGIKEQLASADDPDDEIELSLIDWNTHAIPDDVRAKLHDSMGIKYPETNRFGLEPIRKSEAVERPTKTAPRSPWAGSKRMDANTFWENLRKADNLTQKQFFDTLSSLTTREQRKQWFTSTPLWDQVAPPVIEAILDAITDKSLFEPFVLTSMTHDLVSQYEKVGREEADKTLIRARISQILCQLGNKARVSLAETLKAKAAPDKAASDATLAEIAFESAIAMSKDQIVAYEGLSAIYGMSGDRAKCHDYAKRGLAELAETASLHPAMSGVIPAEAFDEMEQRLRQYLNC